MKHNDPIQHIVFDLTGVLFTLRQSLQLFASIGLLDVLYYVIRYRKSPLGTCYDILKSMHQQELQNYPVIYYKKCPMPRCISEWLMGKVSNQEVMNIIKEYMDTKVISPGDDPLKIRVLHNMLMLMMDARITTSALFLNTNLASFITQLKKSPVKIYILSNFSTEQFNDLNRRYPDFFKLFDDIIISANIGLLKPYEQIYEYLLERHQIDPNQCLFIDDQLENITGAAKLGIQGIQFKNNKLLREKFKFYRLPS